jgi:hypothetical protein
MVVDTVYETSVRISKGILKSILPVQILAVARNNEIVSSALEAGIQ